MRKTKPKPPARGIKHHAKRIYHGTPKFAHGMVVGAFIGIVVIVISHAVASVAALTLTSVRDCDTNAVISCGALTTTELQQKYGTKGVASIYNYFNISANDIKEINTKAVAGRVYKNGNVTIGTTTVATNATTAGRENIAGSTKVTSGGTTFYTRPPSVSFRVDSIAAFVVMEDGQFKYAILGACSNPVKATPVPKKAQTTTPVTTTQPQPEVTTTETVTSTQTPPSTPTPTAVVAASAVSLPDTGPGDILIIGLLAVVGGYIFHVTHRHIKHKRRQRYN